MANPLPSLSLSHPKSHRLSFSPQSESFWESLPSSPGIYIFESADHTPLYIGKSINIRTRINQHFEGFVGHSTKAANFIPLTKYLKTYTVQNDLEAIILEANFIKAYKPKYNSITKDDKSNLYIVFTDFPDTKIKLVYSSDIRELSLDNYATQVYGPYTSVSTADAILKQARKIFGYCLNPFNAKQKACFHAHLHLCPGACDGRLTPKQYAQHLAKIKRFLSGKFLELDQSLEKKIKKSAKKLDFEKAEKLKKQLLALRNTLGARRSSLLLKLTDANDTLLHYISDTLHHPKLTGLAQRIECYDLAHHMGKQYVGSMSVFVNTVPSVKDYRHFNIDLPDQSDPHAMKQVIERRFQHPEWGKPDLIILDGGIPQLSIVYPSIPEEIPVITLAKKRETIYFYDENHKVQSLSLDLDNPVLNLFRSIRDEAHRFANSHHRRQKAKALIYTEK